MPLTHPPPRKGIYDHHHHGFVNGMGSFIEPHVWASKIKFDDWF